MSGGRGREGQSEVLGTGLRRTASHGRIHRAVPTKPIHLYILRTCHVVRYLHPSRLAALSSCFVSLLGTAMFFYTSVAQPPRCRRLWQTENKAGRLGKLETSAGLRCAAVKHWQIEMEIFTAGVGGVERR